MATMKDVAKRAGVSIATVSAVLSGAAFVSPSLKTRVEMAIAELGYARNAIARSLKSGHSSLIGLVVPDITNPFFTSFVDHVQKAADAAGYTVLLGLTDNKPEREPSVLALMRSHQAAGTILCPTGASDAYVEAGARLGTMKLVLADNATDKTDVDTVVIDNVLAAELAARHILSLGHRQIGIMSGTAHQFVAQTRHEAFVKVLAAKSVALPSKRVARGDFREAEAHAAALDLLRGHEQPTALFVANNLMLIGVMRAITELALRVPDDISVISIDDFAWAAAFQPTLTVVKQPIEAIAQTAFDLLLKRIKGDTGPKQRITLPPQLVVRQSCAKVPG
jgi:LacI family transcriptional regulator